GAQRRSNGRSQGGIALGVSQGKRRRRPRGPLPAPAQAGPAVLGSAGTCLQPFANGPHRCFQNVELQEGIGRVSLTCWYRYGLQAILVPRLMIPLLTQENKEANFPEMPWFPVAFLETST
ncbi:unnamed protein product, partial [Gulo gulo]